MTFFNKKEEVLELKLTSYGKQKLAAGTFKPVYYSFFDDDVLYDAARAGKTEGINDIETRIQDETPSLRVQTSFADLEKKVMKQTHELSADGVYQETNVMDLKTDPTIFQDADGLRNVLPLGNSQLGNQYAPSWRIEFLEGKYKASRSSINDNPNLKPIVNIPQITCDLTVQPTLVDKDFVGVVDPETGEFVNANDETNQFIRLLDNYILLDITENNVDLLNDSFELEIYEVLTEDGEEVLKPKMFLKEEEEIVDGILLDPQEINNQNFDGMLDEKIVDYYFKILVDDDIENKIKFEKIASREFRGTIFDNNVGFEEIEQKPGDVLYTSDNDGEEC